MEPPSPHYFTFQNESGIRISVDAVEQAARIAAVEYRLAPGEVSFFFCDNESIKSLNQSYRGINEITDVLTFQAPTSIPKFEEGNFPIPVGDIAISLEYASAQAQIRGVPISDEVSYLAIHGILHLCGFDDVETKDRERMQAAMASVGSKIPLVPINEWTSLLHEIESQGMSL